MGARRSSGGPPGAGVMTAIRSSFSSIRDACPVLQYDGERTEAYARNRPVMRKDHIFDVLADGLSIAKIMVMPDEALIESLPRSTPDHTKIEWKKGGEGAGEEQHPLDLGRFGSFPEKPGKLTLPCRKRDDALAQPGA